MNSSSRAEVKQGEATGTWVVLLGGQGIGFDYTQAGAQRTANHINRQLDIERLRGRVEGLSGSGPMVPADIRLKIWKEDLAKLEADDA